MNTILIVAPLLAGIIMLLYTILANLARVWMDHRIKLALLDRMQQKTGGPDSLEELKALLDGEPELAHGKTQVNYVVTGALLAAIGLCTAFGGYVWGHGQSSAGVYFGGVACVSVGAILVLLGLLLRYLARLPIDPNLK